MPPRENLLAGCFDPWRRFQMFAEAFDGFAALAGQQFFGVFLRHQAGDDLAMAGDGNGLAAFHIAEEA